MRRWTDGDIAALRANWETMTDEQLAEYLGRSRVAITQRRSDLGLTRFRSRVPDYMACAARGMTQTRAAIELGVSRAAISTAAARHGIAFTPGRTYSRGVIDALTPAENKDYRLLRSKRYRRDEALRAIGRTDLIRDDAA